VQSYGPANRAVEYRKQAPQIASAGLLEPALDQPGQETVTTRLRRAWNGRFSSPNCVGVIEWQTGCSFCGDASAQGLVWPLDCELPFQTKLHSAVIHHPGEAGYFLQPASLF
jgi:hypothetical protein